MSYFLTSADIKKRRKVICKGRIVTPIAMAGTVVQMAEDGKWYEHESLHPLAEEQIHELLVQEMVAHCAGKPIITLNAKNKGVQFVLEDNTRITLSCRSGGKFQLSVTDSEGQKVL